MHLISVSERWWSMSCVHLPRGLCYDWLWRRSELQAHFHVSTVMRCFVLIICSRTWLCVIQGMKLMRVHTLPAWLWFIMGTLQVSVCVYVETPFGVPQVTIYDTKINLNFSFWLEIIVALANICILHIQSSRIVLSISKSWLCQFSHFEGCSCWMVVYFSERSSCYLSIWHLWFPKDDTYWSWQSSNLSSSTTIRFIV